MNVVIVNYGMGNICSITGALNYLGVKSDYSKLPDTLLNADKLILPGVGSFAKAIGYIKENKLDIVLKEYVINRKKPILGICLGMQLLGKSSSEEGFNYGLGFVNGEVTKIQDSQFKVPHVGFNQVKTTTNSKLYKGLLENPDFYFTHSYKMLSQENINQCECEYNEKFIASFEYNNIAGVQFHPEISQKNGLTLLKNFIDNF